MTARKLFLVLIVCLEWFAIIAQFVLHMQASPAETTEAVTRFFSFFTILTNILVAVYTTTLLFSSTANQKEFFQRPSVQTAIALYITVVGLVYNIILRNLWESSGLQAVLHDLLHSAAPLLVLAYWWRWVDGKSLRLSNIPAWLIYPAAYAIIVMVRGSFASWYPYPFLDATKLGYAKVLLNSAGLVVVFLVFSLLFVFAGRKKSSTT